jgi:hypothetical protein
VLIAVWELVGEPCGKYLAAMMEDSLRRLTRHGELVKLTDRLSPQVWDELVAMSPATIDRYLAPTKAARYPEAKSATRASNTLRSQIKVRRAGDKIEARPGFFEIDLVAHCGHTLAGEFLWTLTATSCASNTPAGGRPFETILYKNVGLSWLEAVDSVCIYAELKFIRNEDAADTDS